MKALVGGSWEQDLVRSSPAAASPCVTIVRFSLGSWHEDLGQGFLINSLSRSRGDRSYVLSRSLYMILNRSLWEALPEVLV